MTTVPCQYKTGKTLRSSKTSIVKLAVHIRTGTYYACKVYSKKPFEGREHVIKNEIAILKMLFSSHTNIVTMHDYFETLHNLYLCLDLCDGGTLADRVHAKGKYPEQDAADLIWSVFGAIEYFHKSGIVHRNLKPENLVFRNESEYADVIVWDFGISKIVNSDTPNLLTDVSGTLSYIAPEVILRIGHHKPVDIWAMGVVTYFTLCGSLPFEKGTQAEETEAIVAGDYKFEPTESWKDVSRTAREFIKCCLNTSPTERPTAQEMLKHEWFSHGHYP